MKKKTPRSQQTQHQGISKQSRSIRAQYSIEPSNKNKARLQKLRPVDFGLLFLFLCILSYGLIMVLSAGAYQGQQFFDDPYYYGLQQARWAVVGLFFLIIVVNIPYTKYKAFAPLAILACIGLLGAVMFSDAGTTAKGSARWLDLGPISVQPSEFTKLGLIFFAAMILDKYPIYKITKIYPLFLAAGVSILFVFKQPDLGTTIVIAGTFVVMLLQTEMSLIWFIVGLPVVGVAAYSVVRKTTYQWQRILTWMDPWAYATGHGYQIVNSFIAFGSGGLLGVGLGQSHQKFGYLPESHTDMIFAVIGEEIGLMGAVGLVVLFAFFFARAFYLIRRCPDSFGRLLGYGITSSIMIQTVINIAVVTGLFPLTGITLPLISYGGSSLVVTIVEVGILLNISRYRQRLRPVSKDEKIHRQYSV